jgi:hypothetical protein
VSDYTVSMGSPGPGVNVMATITDGPGALEVAEAICKAIAEAAPGREVALWRGKLGKESSPFKIFRGEVETVERVKVQRVRG